MHALPHELGTILGAAIGAFTPTLIGALRDAGTALPTAMAVYIAGASLGCALWVWLGPETRGRDLSDEPAGR